MNLSTWIIFYATVGMVIHMFVSWFYSWRLSERDAGRLEILVLVAWPLTPLFIACINIWRAARRLRRF